ncbi:MAG TPA: T9SS type A sorting domain-containing protein [Chitinophagaceae bacterium]
MKTFLLFTLLSVTCLISFSQSTSLDVTFGTNGIVTTPIGAAGSVIHGMATQNDGKIVVAGSSNDGVNSEFAIARYNTNGSLDNTFDVDGKITTSFGSQAEAFCMAIQSDGKIVAAGYMYNDSTWEFAVARYNVDGSLDSTFDGDGKLTTAISTVDDEINAIAIQSDGKIVVAGYSNASGDINAYEPDLAVVRYNTDGSLDSTFNGNGILITSLGFYDVAYSVAIQTNGKIVLAGTHANGSNYEFLVVRYNIDGSLDNTFNGDGIITTAISSSYDVIHSIAIQNDGKIVASGVSGNGSTYDFSLARYNTDGSLDSTFNDDGKLITAIGTSLDVPTSIVIGSDGKIVVAAGVTDYNNNRDIALVSYNSNGSSDNSFGLNGKIITAIDGNDITYAIKLTDSRIYVSGTNNQFLVAAYQTAFPLPVNLLSFTAALQNNTTKLQWQTTGESTSFFKIERSNDGRNFTNIGELPSLINSSAQKNYLFTDAQPLHGMNFYRLKMMDANGGFTYSKVVAVKMNENTVIMKIFPNPATDLIQIQIPSSQNEKITLQITDAGGKTIKQENVTSNGTTLFTSVDVTTLQKGGYFLSIKTNSGTQVQKFIKQ